MRRTLFLFWLVVLWMSTSFSPVLADSVLEQGKRVADQHCSRCHVVGEANRMGGIGSTPSFALLRRMDDWEERYSSFFARNPHPAFVTVEGLSGTRTLPPNAAPITLTEDEVAALMAYVRSMKTE